MNKMSYQKQLVISAWETGIAAVEGKSRVQDVLNQDDIRQIDQILAIGKAAGSMCEGAMDVYGYDTPALLITKYDHTPKSLQVCSNLKVVESGHPIPDENSLLAGQCAIDFVKSAGSTSKLLVLVSGGASALAEDLVGEMSLEELQNFTSKLIAEGFDITQINTRRQQISNIKGGKLLRNFHGHSIVIYCISDVQGNNIGFIGSGIANPDAVFQNSVEHVFARVIADNNTARNAIFQLAKTIDIPVIENNETLYDDLYKVSDRIVANLIDGQDGLYILGGEPTVQLPDNPGQGGRNQSLALSIAIGIKNQPNIALIVAGTDGTDGPTDAAGGVVDGESFYPLEKAEEALAQANAGPFLEENECLFKTGPTGTNTMDLVIALKLTDESSRLALEKFNRLNKDVLAKEIA